MQRLGVRPIRLSRRAALLYRFTDIIRVEDQCR
jgi:hypothetical protein